MESRGRGCNLNDGMGRAVTTMRPRAKTLSQTKITTAVQDKADLFYQYLHRRMCVRYLMHKDNTILGKNVPKPISDPILDLCISGNAYRHLDTDDHVASALLREHVGLEKGARPSDEQVERMLPVILLRMAGFNEQRMAEAMAEVRGVTKEVAAQILGPTNADEGRHLAELMGRVARSDPSKRPMNPKWLAGGASQVQSFASWSKAFTQWYEVGGARSIKAAVAALRQATSWKEANECLIKTLLNVGAYTSAQGLCTLVFGVLCGDPKLLFGSAYQTDGPGSMLDWCGNGPGPAESIKTIFGKSVGSTLEGIHKLRDGAAGAFSRLELSFPYLGEAGSEGRALTCVDLEHSLCYFSRYLAIRDHLREDEQVELWEYVLARHPPDQRAHQLVERRAIWKLKELVKATEKGGGLEGAKRKADEYFEKRKADEDSERPPPKIGRMGD